MTAAAHAQAITQVLTRVMREDKGRLLSALVYRLRDISLAEDMLQEASISALKHWGRTGVPHSPQGWLLRVALRRAIDRLRANGRAAIGQKDLEMLAREEASETAPEAIPDARLRMMFACCHPALELKTRVALTLRVICGLTTAQIAAVFLDSDVAMGQRLSRAKAKITAAGIGFEIPDETGWPARLNAVQSAIYLIFTRGYAMGPQAGQDLCLEALFLARLMRDLSPDDPEIEGALALLLITQARAGARGQGVALAAQDRALWDEAMLAEGKALVVQALARGRAGPFQVKAAIAACHVAEGGPDWPQIAALLQVLQVYEDTPVTRLSLAVALAELRGAQAGMDILAQLSGELSGYGPYHAAHADMAARLGRTGEARAAYQRAIELSETDADAAFLAARLQALPRASRQ